MRLLSHAEGQALVELGLEHPTANQRLDCSHLVHQILSAAGLVYPYATSFEIFAGIPQFRRIRNPQPGDLIVWPGHVGVVVDKERSTFFSSTGSGLRTDQYSSDYWRRRGYPRFYRYLVSGTTQLIARRAMPKPDVKQVPHAERATSSEQPHLEEQSAETAIDAESLPRDPSYAVPESVQIVSEHTAPTKDDIEEAISELTNASVSALETENRRSMSILFLRSLRVEKVKLKGHKGWVELRVDSRVELNPDGSWKKSRIQKLRCELRRDQVGWALFTPLDRLYVPQNVAIPALAKRVAVLSGLPASAVERRQLNGLAAVLNLLLNGN